MNTHICETCGRDPLVDSTTILSRVNPLGITPARWRCQDCATPTAAQSFRLRNTGLPNYPTHGAFENNPLPWRYNSTTKNVLANDGAIVARVGDDVYGDPRIGELIVKLANALGFVAQE